MEVGAADPDRRHPDEDLARPGPLEVELAHLEGLPGPEEDRCPGFQAPSASITSSALVTVETFCNA
jgi:hypothetical protein